VTIFEKMKAIYREGGLKNVWEVIITVKKRVYHRPKTFEKRCLWCRPLTETSGAVRII